MSLVKPVRAQIRQKVFNRIRELNKAGFYATRQTIAFSVYLSDSPIAQRNVSLQLQLLKKMNLIDNPEWGCWKLKHNETQ